MNTLIGRRNLIACCVAGLLGCGAFAASAQQSEPAPAQVQADAAAQQAQPVDATAKQEAVQPGDAAKNEVADAAPGKNKKMIDRKCLQYTGSRIRAYDEQTRKRLCMAGPGSAYSKDDLDSTGQVDLGKALRQIDPAIKSN